MTRHILFLILLGLCIRIQVVKCTSVCSFGGAAAFCVSRGLHQVPELPRYLQYLDLSYNSIAELNERSFSRLDSLQTLIIKQQTSGLVIRNNTFRRLSNLTLLQLDYNHMLQMETGAFHGLINLEILTLTYCGLDESILSGDFLRPLVSLEILLLPDNDIKRIQPASFFLNMSRLYMLDLSYTKVTSICEKDLLNLQGKHFIYLKLSRMRLNEMNQYWSGWDTCGNPFKNITISTLDLSGNGFNVDMAKMFFDAISGTKIQSLIFSNHYSIGRSFDHANSKDPNKFTFEGLKGSGIKILDLSKSKIFALSNSLFSYLSDLEQVTLAHNEINKIENDAFLGMTNLLKLNLSKNFLGAIDSKTFQNLQKLEVLDLSYNHIRRLGHNSFQGLQNLINLNFTENVIESINNFANLPNLEKLYLHGNKIISLQNLPNISKKLTTLDAEYNKLTSMSDLYRVLQEYPKIETIYLMGNTFMSCFNERYTVHSRQLQLLNLGYSTMQFIWSQGQCLDVFDNLHQLEFLSLKSNGLQSLPKDIFKGLTSLISLDLSFNSLRYLPNGILPRNLQYLNLEYNFIHFVDPNIFSTLTFLSLLKNSFRCDCKLKNFQSWLNQTNVIFTHPIEDLTCASPEDQNEISILKSSIHCEDEEDETSIEKLRLVLFICCSTLITIFTMSAIMYIRCHGYIYKLYKKLIDRLVDGKTEKPESGQFLYDVYLCFSPNDIKWVERALLSRLDCQFSEQNTLRCCFEDRDFIPGEDHLSNKQNAIQSSRKTLCVISEHFLKDGWCLETFSMAQCRMLVELKDILVVLVVGNIPEYRLLKYEPVRPYIENRRYLLWPDDSQDLEWVYDQLLHKIRTDRKIKQRKAKTKDEMVETKPESANVHVDTAV